MFSGKIKPYNDPRVSQQSANLNGHVYGYLYAKSSPSTSYKGTIILIHGFPDLSLGWRNQIPYLCDLGLDVIAIDCMGYGRTDSPRFTIKDYTFKRISDDIAELCRQQNLDQIILGGHDWGGAIVYRIALYFPSLITAIFAVGTPYTPPTPEYNTLNQIIQRIPNYKYQIQFSSGELEHEIRSKHDIRQFFNNIHGATTPEGKRAFNVCTRVDFDKQRRLRENEVFDADEFSYYVDEYARHGINGPLNWYRSRELNFEDEWQYFFEEGRRSSQDVMQELEFEQEVLFIVATNDEVLRPGVAEEMVQIIPKLTTRMVNAGHWALWEKPNQCNDLIGEWLQSKVFKTPAQ
ncbi:hypothetical protein LTR84_010672 [Exophiala bonariae]|uniref:AB hydrolase-1 domain-containing protein n=1 Tax=Exophiala bonariae TaxID=1690606 RepID=A0AAV9MVC8_9EURO|nr:hypothetical protein LTR84_010672 [Exophiala bonariae]